ncbi:MAG: hypothetical protein C6P35_12965 [Cohnella sp.]|uniref:hypothetical protein n=1 Tax=Cohnella sp. TaxID=1883426 RepID=UPI000E395545|nr:hypothetical protein [Cohnella sp.]REK64398.1 MAG: hypothetical protein C6P35_12965 [Cohnella sp.]
MPVFTSLWNLLKKNPATDGADTFNIQTMLNDNWDKIDAALGLKAVNADVRAATTANITLSGLQTIDGVALAAGDRVLVKNQTTGSQNGIYTAAEGPWTRATDADVSGKLASGLLVYVKEGSSNGKKQWRLSNTGPITLGTTALTFELVAGADSATDAVIGNRTITDTTAPAGDSGTLTSLFGWLGYMIKAITGKSSWRTAPATTLEAAKAHMDATAGVHGATSAATAGAIMQRDASGRAKVAAPSAADDIARKAEVDAAIATAAADATNKADAVQANLTAHIGSGGTAHAVATASAAGFMSAADKSKLDGIAAGANNYTHPTGDGNLHVPATGTTNNGKVLKAGSTAGSIAWGNVAFSELTGKPTTLSGYGITDAAPSSHVGAGGTAHAVATTSAAGFMSAADKAKLDGITDGATAGTATPLMDGTAAVGTSTAYAREDHRHPTDTTRAPLASPAFTGTPTAPTAAAGTNNTQIATTAFVNTAIAALPFNMARQAIINGNFDIWQRGTSFSAILSDRLYYADRWCSDGFRTAATSISRQTLATGTIPGATYCHRFSTGGAGSGYVNDTYCRTMQLIEHGTRLLAGSGNKITVSFWARSSIANKKFGLMLSQEYGSGGSPSTRENIAGRYYTLTPSWQKFTHTFTLNSLSGKTFGTNNDDRLVVQFWYAWGSNHASLLGDTVEEQFRAAGDIDIAQVQVNAGDTALPFQPRSWAEELTLCQRYYETGVLFCSGGHYDSGYTRAIFTKSFAVPKRTNPTITFLNRVIKEANSVTNEEANYTTEHLNPPDGVITNFARLGSRPLPLQMTVNYYADAEL